MKTLTNSWHVQYAVIQIRQTDGGIERFVLSYHDEQVLREFLAKPCIAASGFSSPDEATASSCRVKRWNRARLLRVVRGFLMNSVAHVAGVTRCKIQSRLMQALRRLEPAVR